MQDTPISEVSIGSRLAKPVLDQNGRVLLAEGAVLTAGVIERLELWQVSAVSVAADSDSEACGLNVSGAFAHLASGDWDALFEHLAPSEERDILQQAFREWCRSENKEGTRS